MDFDTWLAEQPEDVQGMIAGHVQGLTSALASERDARKQLSTDLKTAVKDSGTSSETRLKLEKMTTDLDYATGRADFFAAGHKAGVSNLSLAFLAAKESDLTGDFDGLKELHPELFGGTAETIVLGNGGNGRDGDSAGESGTSMDDLIRQSVGVL